MMKVKITGCKYVLYRYVKHPNPKSVGLTLCCLAASRESVFPSAILLQVSLRALPGRLRFGGSLEAKGKGFVGKVGGEWGSFKNIEKIFGESSGK